MSLLAGTNVGLLHSSCRQEKEERGWGGGGDDSPYDVNDAAEDIKGVLGNCDGCQRAEARGLRNKAGEVAGVRIYRVP